MRRDIELNGNLHEVVVTAGVDSHHVAIDAGERFEASLRDHDEGRYRLTVDGEHHDVELLGHGQCIYIRAFGRTFTLSVLDPVEQAAQRGGAAASSAKAPMPGTVVEVRVEPDQAIERGQLIMTIESMKILTHINAWRDGVVESVRFGVGDTFDKDAVLVTLRDEATQA